MLGTWRIRIWLRSGGTRIEVEGRDVSMRVKVVTGESGARRNSGEDHVINGACWSGFVVRKRPEAELMIWLFSGCCIEGGQSANPSHASTSSVYGTKSQSRVDN